MVHFSKPNNFKQKTPRRRKLDHALAGLCDSFFYFQFADFPPDS